MCTVQSSYSWEASPGPPSFASGTYGSVSPLAALEENVETLSVFQLIPCQVSMQNFFFFFLNISLET